MVLLIPVSHAFYVIEHLYLFLCTMSVEVCVHALHYTYWLFFWVIINIIHIIVLCKLFLVTHSSSRSSRKKMSATYVGVFPNINNRIQELHSTFTGFVA